MSIIEQEMVAKLKELNLIPSAPSTASSDLSDIPTVRVKCLNKFPRSAPSYTSTCSLSVESGKWRAERFSALTDCVDDLMTIENAVPDENLALIGRWREVPDFPDEQTEFPDKETPQELQARWEYAVSVAERNLNWEEDPM